MQRSKNASVERSDFPPMIPAMATKRSTPEKVDGIWRIRRHDGVLVGAYATKALAQRAIDNSSWLL